MKLIDLIKIAKSENTDIHLDLGSKRLHLKSLHVIPADYCDADILALNFKDGLITITLTEPPKIPTLEELGFNFDVGV